MYTKEALIESLRDEVRIINHLYEKIPDDGLSYRPTEKQRSLEELLQYLSYMGEAMVKTIRDGSFDSFKEHRDEATTIDIKTFPQAMEAQLDRMEDMINEMGENLSEEIVLFGPDSDKQRSLHMVDLMLKMFTAYRMQLFLYLKSAGRPDLDSSNLWSGMDNPKK